MQKMDEVKIGLRSASRKDGLFIYQNFM